MFEVLFIYPKVLARHQAGPAALDRERYLAHCAGQGAARGTLLRIARELLVIAERIDVTVGKSVTRSEINAAARAWARQQKRRCRTGSKQWSRHLFAQVAAAWLRFLGILEEPPHSERNAFFSRDVDEFIARLRDERGLSPNTVGSRRWQIEGFLDHVSTRKVSIASITVADVDTFLESKGRENWFRVSVASCATALRSFFRYADTYRMILLLLYGAGLRISEALALTMADVDVDAGVLCIRESKFYKSRLVPIGDDLQQILAPYAARRHQRHAGAASPFFVSRRGSAVTRQDAERAFCRLRVRANVVREAAGARHQPRLHNMRHAFAVHRLVSWYREGADVQRLLPKLSTYLGHVHVAGTRRYLTMTPELLRQANLRFERYAMEPSHE